MSTAYLQVNISEQWWGLGDNVECLSVIKAMVLFLFGNQSLNSQKGNLLNLLSVFDPCKHPTRFLPQFIKVQTSISEFNPTIHQDKSPELFKNNLGDTTKTKAQRIKY